MIHLLQEQMEARKQNKAYAMVTLVKTQGATPRGVGSKMMVFADGATHGTIGGGQLEDKVIADAVECLGSNGKWLREYENKTLDSGPACGSRITVYIEAVTASARLVVCGAGHVGGAVIALASSLQYDVTALDTRQDDEMIRQNAVKAGRLILAESFGQGIASLEVGSGAFYLISTYGHSQDAEALAAVLDKEPGYVGMMGSPGKIKDIFNRLKEQGFSEEQLQTVYTPIGLDIGGETPPEIAVSILAEMQMVRYGKAGLPMRKPATL